MNKKILAFAFIACTAVFIATAGFIASYYNCIKPNHEGPMDLWAIATLIATAIAFCVLSFLIRKNNVVFYDCFKGGKTVEKIFQIIFIIIFSPLILLILVFALIYAIIVPEKAKFKPLVKKGFKLQKQDDRWLLSKQSINIVFPFNYSAPLISFDGGNNFNNLFEVEELGSEQERAYLKQLQHEYDTAHPLDKQRGDITPPTKKIIIHLQKYL